MTQLKQLIEQSKHLQKEQKVAQEAQEVYDFLKQNPGATSAQMGMALSLSPDQVSRRLQWLRKREIVRYVEKWEIRENLSMD